MTGTGLGSSALPVELPLLGHVPANCSSRWPCSPRPQGWRSCISWLVAVQLAHVHCPHWVQARMHRHSPGTAAGRPGHMQLDVFLISELMGAGTQAAGGAVHPRDLPERAGPACAGCPAPLADAGAGVLCRGQSQLPQHAQLPDPVDCSPGQPGCSSASLSWGLLAHRRTC